MQYKLEAPWSVGGLAYLINYTANCDQQKASYTHTKKAAKAKSVQCLTPVQDQHQCT